MASRSLRCGIDLTDRVGHSGVGVIAVDDDAAVDGEDVPLFEDALGVGDAMDDLVVDRGAEGGGVAVIALEGGDGAEFGYLFDGDVLEIHRGRAGDDVGRDGIVDLAKGLAGDPHLFDLLRRFDHNGHAGTGLRLQSAEKSQGKSLRSRKIARWRR